MKVAQYVKQGSRVYLPLYFFLAGTYQSHAERREEDSLHHQRHGPIFNLKTSHIQKRGPLQREKSARAGRFRKKIKKKRSRRRGGYDDFVSPTGPHTSTTFPFLYYSSNMYIYIYIFLCFVGTVGTSLWKDAKTHIRPLIFIRVLLAFVPQQSSQKSLVLLCVHVRSVYVYMCVSSVHIYSRATRTHKSTPFFSFSKEMLIQFHVFVGLDS